MGSSDIRAGKAFVELQLEKSAFTKGLQSIGTNVAAAGRGLQTVGIQMAAAGAAITVPALAAAHAWAESGAAIARLSQRTGQTVESLSSLGYAFQETLGSADAMPGAMAKMSKALTAAAAGSAEATVDLARLRLTIGEIMALSPEKRFEVLADRISKIQDPNLRAGMAMKFFGRSADEMLPLLNRGADGIAELRKEAEEMGLVRTGASATAALELSKAWERMGRMVGKLGGSVAEAIAPMLLTQAQAMTTAARQAADWLKAHQPLVQSIFRFATAATVGGAALIGFGTALSIVGGRITSSVKSFTALAGILARPFEATIRVGWGALAAGARAAGSASSTALRGAALAAGLAFQGAAYAASVAWSAAALAARVAWAATGVSASVVSAGFSMAASVTATAWGLIPSAIGLIGSATVASAQGAVGGVKLIHGAMTGLVAFAKTIPSIIRAVPSALATGAGAVKSAFLAIPALISTAYSAAATVVSAVWTVASGIASTAWSVMLALPGLIAMAWTVAGAIVSTAWTLAAAGVSLAWSALMALPAALSATWAAVAAALPAILTAAVVAGVVVAAAVILSKLSSAFLGAGRAAGESLRRGMQSTVSGVERVISATGTAIDDATQKAKGLGAGIRDGVTSAATAAAAAASDLGQKFSQAGVTIVEGFQTIVPKIGEIFTNIWGGFLKEAKDTFGVVAASLKSGDIKAAIPVIVAYFKLNWLRLMLFLQESFEAFMAWWETNGDKLLAPIKTLIGDIQNIIDKLNKAIADATRVANKAQEIYELGTDANPDATLAKRQKTENDQAEKDEFAQYRAMRAKEREEAIREAIAIQEGKQRVAAKFGGNSASGMIQESKARQARLQKLLDETTSQTPAPGDATTPDATTRSKSTEDRKASLRSQIEEATADLKNLSTDLADKNAKQKEDAEDPMKMFDLDEQEIEHYFGGHKGQNAMLGATKISGTFNGSVAGMMGGQNSHLQALVRLNTRMSQTLDHINDKKGTMVARN